MSSAHTPKPGLETAAPALKQVLIRPRVPTLFISNLPQNIAAQNVEDVFHAAGHEVSVELLRKGHGANVKTCGLGIATFKDPQANLDRCIEALDGQPLWGRPFILRKDRFVEDAAAYEHVPHAAPSPPRTAKAH